MIEFLSVLSDVLFVFFIISSFIFGVSFSVKIYAMRTVRKVVRESCKNYEKIDNIKKISRCNNIVDSHIEKYLLYQEISRKNNRIKRRNKIRKLFRLKERELLIYDESLKEIFLSLLKDISSVFEGSGGYLNYSKNELVEILKKLCDRVNSIFESSGIIWFKSIKISTLFHVVDTAKTFSRFKGKAFVVLIATVMEFCFFVSRFISPVGASKKLANSIVGNKFSSLIVSSSFNLIGKEWAVLCADKEKSRLSKNRDKKVA